MLPVLLKPLLEQGSLLLAQDLYNETVCDEDNDEPGVQIFVLVQMKAH